MRGIYHLEFRKTCQAWYRARSRSVKSEAMLLVFFQDKKPQCVTRAKRFTEPSKIFLLSCKSPDSASTFLGRELGATPLVDELDESENSEAHKASLHTASYVDIFLKKHERTDYASVLLGVKLYELVPELSTVCVPVFLARKDCALALLEESEKSALETQVEIVLQHEHRIDVIWAPHYCTVEGLVAVALSCKDKKVLVLDDLTSSQDKRLLLLKKISVSNSANQHKCPARPQGCEIFSSSCNALLTVTKDDTVTEGSKNLWLPIKHGARVSQKDKLGLTFFFAILLPGWIPVVNAVDENAFLRGTITPCTWFWIIIITIASAYCAYKILRRSPPEPYLFSEKVGIWINGEMIVVELYDDEGILVGSWRCALFTANGNAVDFTEWVTNLFNFVLHIFVQQEDGVEEISFNQMDDPEFIGMPMDVYLHNPDTGRLRYIGRSVPQNGTPSERDIIILMELITYELVQQFLM